MRHVYFVSFSHMQQGIGFGFGWRVVYTNGPITTEATVNDITDVIRNEGAAVMQ